MNTCGINIGEDCENIITEYIWGMEHSDKMKRICSELRVSVKYDKLTFGDKYILILKYVIFPFIIILDISFAFFFEIVYRLFF